MEERTFVFSDFCNSINPCFHGECKNVFDRVEKYKCICHQTYEGKDCEKGKYEDAFIKKSLIHFSFISQNTKVC